MHMLIVQYQISPRLQGPMTRKLSNGLFERSFLDKDHCEKWKRVMRSRAKKSGSAFVIFEEKEL